MSADLVTVEVVGNAMLSIAEEMGATLIRTAYSTNIKERRDCSTAIFDTAGRTIAQADHIPVHLGSLLGIVGKILEKYNQSDIHPGDMFIANDPYSGGGTHLPDITIAAPVFFEGKLVAFVANIAHHSDVGGKVPGSSSASCNSIFQEGLRMPPIKFMDKGAICQDVLDVILLNCRTPRERQGDLRAQVAANQTGLARIADLYQRYGPATVQAVMEELLNYAERKIRAGIARIPDGSYEFEDFVDDDGFTSDPIKIKVTVTIKNQEIVLDFTGTDPQVHGGINSVLGATLATVYYAVKAIIDPTIPNNGGFYRAIKVVAPEATIVNPLPPAPVAGRTDTCQRIADVVFGALSKAIPLQVIAGCNSAVTSTFIAGENPRRREFFVYVESLGGGSGARPIGDGMDGVHVHITNSSNLPVESLESEYPLLVERYEFIPDSGGAGQYRGGLGIRRDIQASETPLVFASHADRQKLPPWGLFGGLDGAPGRFVLNPGTQSEKVLPSKAAEVALQPGDVLSVRTPGSGGYGNPLKRDPELVVRDVVEGKISVEAARKNYKVVVDKERRKVDRQATEKLT